MQIQPAERVLLRSVEWLTFHPNNYEAALRQGNALLRYLLGVFAILWSLVALSAYLNEILVRVLFAWRRLNANRLQVLPGYPQPANCCWPYLLK
jgi:hypothetical protein